MAEPSAAAELGARFVAQEIEIYGAEVILDLRAGSSQKKVPAPTGPSQTRQPSSLMGAVLLSDLYEQSKGCVECALGYTRRHFVFGSGNPDATLMLIGEAPGQEEDAQGLPFVGAAGQLLTRILGVAGFSRDEVYIANILKCRPPGNRVPLPEEAERCKPYLLRQIELIKPRYIFCLGRTSAQSLLGLADTLARLRQQSYRLGDAQVFVTYHPSALLRNPQWRWECYEDIKRFRTVYDGEVGDKPPLPQIEGKRQS